MQGDLDVLMLVCAALAALASGVLTGYACCKIVFFVLRSSTHPEKAKAGKVETSHVPSTMAS